MILWAVTMAGPNGRGGKAMPIDPVEDPAGNTIVRPAHGRRLLARVLAKDETHTAGGVEYLAMPHFATCARLPSAPHTPLPDHVDDLTAHRNRKAHT